MSGRLVILLQRSTEPACLYPHDRVAVGIEVAVASEDIGRNSEGLDALCTAGQGLLDHIGEEVP
ncbi:hypothetical protein [Labrys miyagiensis]